MTQERAGAVDFTVPFMDSQLVIMAKEVNRKVIFYVSYVLIDLDVSNLKYEISNICSGKNQNKYPKFDTFKSMPCQGH